MTPSATALLERETPGLQSYEDIVVFSISARNYIPYARTLFDSLRKTHPGINLYLALADSSAGIDPADHDYNILDLESLEDDRVWGMAERYNVTEFNTSIKPIVFQRLIERHPGQPIFYFDPDIMVLSPIEEAITALRNGAQAVMTPHILDPIDHPWFQDQSMLRYGVYNLGFLGLRGTPEAAAAMRWWADRLEHSCGIDLANGLFVDQKWADLLPSLLDRVHILRHPGYNVAYWNLLQRTIKHQHGRWTSNDEPLRFFHFSGADITQPATFSRHAPHFDHTNIGDARFLLEAYREQVLDRGFKHFGAFDYAFKWSGAGSINLHTPESVKQKLAAGTQLIDRALAPFTARGTGRPSSDHQAAYGDLFSATVSNWDDYQRVLRENASVWEAQRKVEDAIQATDPEIMTNTAVCAMCRAVSPMVTTYLYSSEDNGRRTPNWREHATCRCGFPNRIRAAMHALQTIAAPADDASIYITEQVTPLFKWLSLRYDDVQGSEYLGSDIAPGAVINGVRHEDLCNLSLPDNTYDVVLSFDVLEHVENFESALAHLVRILKPGGTLMFAAPTQLEQKGTMDLVVVREDGSYDYRLQPPEYHGNPVDPENGALCFRRLGLETLDMLRNLGMATAEAIFYWSKDYGYLGAEQMLYCGVKAADTPNDRPTK